MKLCVLTLFTIALSACPQPASPQPDADAQPPDAAPSPPPDASPSSLAACANMRALGCAEGAGSCEERLDLLVADKLLRPPIDRACLASASSRDDARKCHPSVSCP